MKYPNIKDPYKVLLKKGEFVDEARVNGDGSVRAVPYKIYYPSGHDLEKMPVILWSHGFGGNANGAAFISRFLAGQGYTLVHMTHHGTDSSLWEGKPGHPWDVLRKVKVSRQDTLNRFLDVPFVLDALRGWADENPEIGQFMDFDALGMSGHSFGAMTTQVMAGQAFPDEDGALISLKEPRFKAGILYSPVPIRHLVDDSISDGEIYGPIDLPLLHMTGTGDDSPLEEIGYEYRLAVYEHSGAGEKYLLVKKDGDHMVYNGTRGKLGDSDLRELHEEIVCHTALAFWDMKLKGDQAAGDWMTGDGLVDYLGDAAVFKADGS